MTKLANITTKFGFSQHTLLLLLLGFSSGLPLALTSGTLQAWITVAGVSTETIGFFSLVTQAYVFKFLWAPLMDRYSLPFLGRRRGWLLTTQLCLVASLFAMSLLQPESNLLGMALLAVAVAFFSASQDVVFDAYRTDILSAAERGTGAAVSVLGYRLALLISSGLAMWIAHNYIGWQATYLLMAGLMLVGVAATLMSKEPILVVNTPKTLEQAFTVPLFDFFKRNNTCLLLMLIVLYKLGDAFAMALSTTFLIRGVGFDAGEIGAVNKTLGLIATILGALYGGVLMKKLSLFRALMIFGLLQGVSNIGYWFLAITEKNIYSMASVIFIENVFSGMGTIAFVALLMTLCNRSFSASQFALLSALSAAGRVYVPPVAAWFAVNYGWPNLYLFAVAAAFPGLLILLICRQTLEHAHQTGEFMPRVHFARQYQWVLNLMLITGAILTVWLVVRILNALAWLNAPELANQLLVTVFIIATLAIFLGCVLDYLGLRRGQLHQ